MTSTLSVINQVSSETYTFTVIIQQRRCLDDSEDFNTVTLPEAPLFTLQLGQTLSVTFTDPGFTNYADMCGARSWSIVDPGSGASPDWVQVAQVGSTADYTITVTPVNSSLNPN